jgi:hypothetical protein
VQAAATKIAAAPKKSTVRFMVSSLVFAGSLRVEIKTIR